MAKALAFVPYGFSKEEIEHYIRGVQDALRDAFGIPDEQNQVFCVLLEPEDYCEIQASKTSLNVFMPFAATEEQKDQFALLYKQACDRSFGEKALLAIATIDEHTPDQEYHNGALLSQA